MGNFSKWFSFGALLPGKLWMEFLSSVVAADVCVSISGPVFVVVARVAK